ncbi:hypothetical protein J7J81_02190 [bacterium]|nr:hypothetical protein [bacterium]
MQFRKFITILVLVLLLIGSVVGFLYFREMNFSKGALKLEILGPQHPKTGENVEYLVKYRNNSNITLEDAHLSFTYPDKAVPQDGGNLVRQKEIGDIYPGQEESFSFKASLFGKEGDLLVARARVEYRPKNLKAYYQSQTTFTCQIQQVPLNFEFDLPPKVESGQNLSFSINYFSHFPKNLENMRVKIEYPQGFNFQSSSPQALDATEWLIPVLPSADGGRIKVKGVIYGNVGEQKFFRAQIGLVRNNSFIVLKEATQIVAISEPSLYISQLVNGSPNYTAGFGETLHYEVFFRNIGKTPIQHKSVIVRLNSPIFDLQSLKAEEGIWGKGDNTIIFDWKNIPKLRFLDIGEEGSVNFWIKTKEENSESLLVNPVLRDRVSVGGAEKDFALKVNSSLTLSQKVYFYDTNLFPTSSPVFLSASSTLFEFSTSSSSTKEENVFRGFNNKGPLPPVVSQTTTYTVIWQVRNTCNEVDRVKVRTVLPGNIKFQGRVFPQDARVTFDSVSRELIWTLGKVDSARGIKKPAFAVAFQLSLIPALQDKGTLPVIIAGTEISGEDAFTGKMLKYQAPPVNTALPDDKAVSLEQGRVR